jgi:hypothetical protein
MPKPNVGEIDRIIRVIAGFGIILWGLINDSWWAVLGLFVLATGMMGYCWLYSLLGLSTCPVKKAPPAKTAAKPKTKSKKK